MWQLFHNIYIDHHAVHLKLINVISQLYLYKAGNKKKSETEHKGRKIKIRAQITKVKICTIEKKFLCEHMFSILFGMYQEWNCFIMWSFYVLHLRNFQMLFQRGCTILHSHQQYMRVLISPYPYQNLLSDFLILAILMDEKWYLIAADWIFVSSP